MSLLGFLYFSNVFIIYDVKGASSRWSAHRIRDEYGNKFDAAKAAKEGRPVLFTGEVWKKRNISLAFNSMEFVQMAFVYPRVLGFYHG